MGSFAPEVTKECRFSEERAILDSVPPGWGWGKLVRQVLPESTGAWRNLPFEGMNHHKDLIPAPSGPYRGEGGPALVPAPSLSNGSPRELLAKFQGDFHKGKLTLHSLVGCLLSHGLPPAPGSPEWDMDTRPG